MSYPLKTGIGLGLGLSNTGFSMGSNTSRYFRKNLGTIDYAAFESDIALLGDCEISFQMYLSDASTPQVIIGNSSGSANGIFVANGDISVRDSGSTTIFTTGDVIPSNQFVHIMIQVISSNVEIFVNGNSSAAGAITGSFTFNELYSRQGGQLILAGVVSDLKISSEGVLIHDLPITEPSGSVIFDKVGGNNATIFNGVNLDRGLFTDHPTLWRGQNLSAPPWNSVNQELLKA